LSQASVIKKVSQNFVPVALNRLEVRKSKGSAGDFFRALEKQKPDQYQGLWIVSPAGKVLANQPRQPKKKNWTDDVLDLCDQAVAAYGEVTPRRAEPVELLADRGRGCRSDKSIVLVVNLRRMEAGATPKGSGGPAIDSVVLTDEERKQFELAGARAGDEVRIDTEVVQKLHKVLSPITDHTLLPRADEVTKAALTVRVASVRDGIAYLKFQGRIAGSHLHDAGVGKGKRSYGEVLFAGGGTSEAKTGKLLSIFLIGEGRHRGPPPWDDVVKYGAVVEWRLKR
jgi:hypothetical protein